MNRFLLLLVPAALFAGQARYARLGEFDGKVEVQLHAGDAWSPAERNLPLAESAWLRTGASSRLEIELDDGSVLEETVEYPIGHRRRRDEGLPLLVEKFKTNLKRRFDECRQQKILDASLDRARLESMPVNEYVDLYVV